MAAAALHRIPEGRYTLSVYTLINDGRYEDVLKILATELETSPKSRAALSLSAYCAYVIQDFETAATHYETLTQEFPEHEEYKLYWAQCLYKVGQYEAASKVAVSVESPEYSQRQLKIQSAIKYEQDDVAGTRSFAEQCAPDPDVLVIQGCALYKEGLYEKAQELFTEGMASLGYTADLLYNVAVCHYRQRNYGEALKAIADIIEKGIRDHPELSVGSTTEGIDVKSVGNTRTLAETCLVEAFNLKAAIEYLMKDNDAAQDALSDMPPRSAAELDPYTLHNQGLMSMSKGDGFIAEGFEKLQFLLSAPVRPPETFGNLLLLYCKYGLYSEAADTLADHAELSLQALSPRLYDFIDGLILSQTSPEEAYNKLEGLARRHVDSLRKLTKKVQDARLARDSDTIKAAIRQYDDALEQEYIPVWMAQAKIYWDMARYDSAQAVINQAQEFCSESDLWKLNMAHVHFVQEQYPAAIELYEPLVEKKMAENILDVTPIVLANLCVAYIMNNRNEDAEELIKLIDRAENAVAVHYPSKPQFHLCIVNLVIGTLYSAKGNFDFGTAQIMKSLQPYEKRLGTDTWHYTKVAFLSLFETLAKHLIMLKDDIMDDILEFLENCELHGASITTQGSYDPESDPAEAKRKTVAYEARMLKVLLMKIRAGA